MLNILNITPVQFFKCFVISLIVKFAYLFWQIHEFAAIMDRVNTMALPAGDAPEYISAAVNIAYNNFFYPNGKTPGLALILFTFFKLFGTNYWLSAFVIFQTIVSSLSVFIFAKIVYLLTNSIKYFAIGFYIYLISTYVSVFDKCILTESLNCSFMIFGLYFLLKALKHVTVSKYYFLAGIFVTVTVFIRPVMMTLFIPACCLLFYAIIFKKFSAKSLLIFLLPFVIIDGLWIIRNENVYKRFIPLWDSKYHSTTDNYWHTEAQFFSAWGGDYVYWDATAEIQFFGEPGRTNLNGVNLFPDHIYTGDYNLDSLKNLRRQMALYDSQKVKDTLLCRGINATFKRYESSYLNAHPLSHYFAPFRVLKKFLYNSGGTSNLFFRKFSELSLVEKIVKLFFIALYLSVIIIGVICTILLLFPKNCDLITGLLGAFILFSLFIICFYFKISEYRYLLPLYPVFIVNSLVCLSKNRTLNKTTLPE